MDGLVVLMGVRFVSNMQQKVWLPYTSNQQKVVVSVFRLHSMLFVLWPLPPPPPSFPLLSPCVINTFSKGLSFPFGKTNPIVNMKITTNNYLSISPSYSPNYRWPTMRESKKTHMHPGLVSLSGKKENPIVNMKIVTKEISHLLNSPNQLVIT